MTVETPIVHASYAFGAFGRMSICLWNGAVALERVEAVVQECRAQCRRYPDGGGFLLLIGPSTKAPSAEARAMISAAFDEMAPRIHSAAVVVRETGFLAAAARSVMSFIFFAMRTPIRTKVFSTLDEAAKWQGAVAQAPEPLDVPQYLGAVDTVIARFREARRVGPRSEPPTAPSHERAP